MEKRFATKIEAAEAGYRAPKWSELAELFAPSKDLRVVVVDTSGPHERGYAFSLKVHSAHDIYVPGAAEDHRQAFMAVDDRVLAVTEALWLKGAPDQLGRPGSFVIRFSPQALEQARQRWDQAQLDYAEALTAAREGLRPLTLEESIHQAVAGYQAQGLDGSDVHCVHEGRQLRIWCNLALPVGDQVSISVVEGPREQVVTHEYADVIQQVLQESAVQPELSPGGPGM